MTCKLIKLSPKSKKIKEKTNKFKKPNLLQKSLKKQAFKKRLKKNEFFGTTGKKNPKNFKIKKFSF